MSPDFFRIESVDAACILRLNPRTNRLTRVRV